MKCVSSVARGGVVDNCKEDPGHQVPHRGVNNTWTLPGETRVPGVEVAYPTTVAAPTIVQAIADAQARGVTGEQIAKAIEGLHPEVKPCRCTELIDGTADWCPRHEEGQAP